MQERSLALAGRAEARPLQEPRNATSLLDRSIGSESRSRENSKCEKDNSICTISEQMRWMDRLM